MATATELQQLKEQWKADPIWNLPETEGFEEHREELEAYQEAYHKACETAHLERLQKRAAKMGIPDNLDLAKYIRSLEFVVETLQAKVERLEEQCL